MKACRVAAIIVLALAFSALPLAAHHIWPIDHSKLVTVTGTVVEVSWKNPHPMVTLDVRGTDGKTEKWLVGGPSIPRMEGNGWTKDTLKPGDTITGIGYQLADGQHVIRLERVKLASGRELLVYAER